MRLSFLIGFSPPMVKVLVTHPVKNCGLFSSLIISPSCQISRARSHGNITHFYPCPTYIVCGHKKFFITSVSAIYKGVFKSYTKILSTVLCLMDRWHMIILMEYWIRYASNKQQENVQPNRWLNSRWPRRVCNRARPTSIYCLRKIQNIWNTKRKHWQSNINFIDSKP